MISVGKHYNIQRMLYSVNNSKRPSLTIPYSLSQKAVSSQSVKLAEKWIGVLDLGSIIRIEYKESYIQCIIKSMSKEE